MVTSAKSNRMRYLSTVKEIIRLMHGIYAMCPGVPPGAKRLPVVPGTPMELRLPDGRILTVKADGILSLASEERNKGFPIGLPPEIGETDIPIGTEIWVPVDQEV